MSEKDPPNLQRFLTAQAEDYKCALSELQRGRKESHWIWYIFPQVAGLGHSSTAQQYAIQFRDEAVAILVTQSLALGCKNTARRSWGTRTGRFSTLWDSRMT